MNAYKDILELVADDAAFLFVLRGVLVNQPHCYLHDIEKMDDRIDKKLNALLTSPDVSWDICLEAIRLGQAGELFMAAVLALRGKDPQKIQHIIDIAVTSDEGITGFAYALSWLPGHVSHAWIKKFLLSDQPNSIYIAVIACSLRREDPREYLTRLLKHEQCKAHNKLYARSLRLIGELKRSDLFAHLSVAMQSDQPDVVFWASWSAVLLGDKSAMKTIQPFVLSENEHQTKAIELGFRVLPVKNAHAWISHLSKDPAQIRNVIIATACLGDPHAVNWLITQMRVPALSRLAGEAFTTITGIDLEEHGLALDEPPNAQSSVPKPDRNDSGINILDNNNHDSNNRNNNNENRDQEDEDPSVNIDEDERLPFPAVEKVAAHWQKVHQQFVAGQRYLLGENMTAGHLKAVYTSAKQRQRRAAALEIALLQPSQYLLNHGIKGLTAQ